MVMIGPPKFYYIFVSDDRCAIMDLCYLFIYFVTLSQLYTVAHIFPHSSVDCVSRTSRASTFMTVTFSSQKHERQF